MSKNCIFISSTRCPDVKRSSYYKLDIVFFFLTRQSCFKYTQSNNDSKTVIVLFRNPVKNVHSYRVLFWRPSILHRSRSNIMPAGRRFSTDCYTGNEHSGRGGRLSRKKKRLVVLEAIARGSNFRAYFISVCRNPIRIIEITTAIVVNNGVQ